MGEIMVSIYGPRDSKFDPIVREKEARIAALGAERDALLANNAKLRELLHKGLMGGVFFASDLVDEVKALGEASHD
jgi:hypothetical protein